MNFDVLFLHWVQSFNSPLLDLFFSSVTLLGDYGFWFVVAALIYWSGREKKGLMLISLVLVASIFAGALKIFFKRPRPSMELFRVLESADSFSFPSGHATIIASTAAFFFSHKRKIQTIGLIMVMLLVGYSRMYLGVHYLSDVIAGILLGGVVGWWFTKLSKRIETSDFSILDNEDRVFYLFIVLSSILVLIFFNSVVMVAAVLGFFAGFILHREARLPCNSAVTGRKLLVKELNGINGLLLIGVILMLFPSLENIVRFGLLFLAGLWVSFLFPALYERVAGHSKNNGFK